MNPLLNIAGKIVTYSENCKIAMGMITVTTTVTADVAVEVTITPKTGAPITFMIQGSSTQVQEGGSLFDAVVVEMLDRALRKCVEKFLEDYRFRALIKS